MRDDIIKISARLKKAAEYIPPGARVADIGCDHGKLAAWLILGGRASRVIATDILPGPLARAERTVARFGLADRISLVLGDGLTCLEPGQADVFVIAGMGGETIAGIIGASGWPPDSGLFILSPMTGASDLRRYLCLGGWKIIAESLCLDGGRLHELIVSGGRTEPLCPGPGRLYAGLKSGDDPLYPRHLDRLIIRFTRAVRGIERSPRPELLERLSDYSVILSELEQLRDEYYADSK